MNEGLALRPAHLQGITDAFPIGSVIGVEDEDFISFYRLVVKAANIKELVQLFDFVDKADGSTFVAIYSQTGGFQTFLAQDDDHLDASPRTLTLKNPDVSKIYEGLLKLRRVLST
jgi:hypothetical protein